MLGASLINFPEAATLLESDPGITCAAFSSDGQLLFAGCDDGPVRIFDPDTGELRIAIPLFNKEAKSAIAKLAIQSSGSAFLVLERKTNKNLELGDAKTFGVHPFHSKHPPTIKVQQPILLPWSSAQMVL